MFKVFLIFLQTSIILTINHHERILNGQKAEPGQFPYLAGLFVNIDGPSYSRVPSIWCSAAILNKNWAVIPAHCVVDLRPNSYCLLTGTNSLTSGGTNHTIQSVQIHPNYTYTGYTFLNDVALLKVENFEFSDSVTNIEIGDVSTNEFCTIMGWGGLDDGTYPVDLYFAQMKTIDDVECKKLADQVPYPIHLGDDEICTFSSDGLSVPCNSDAGPLVCDGKAVAVLSYAIFGCEPTLPVVYAKLKNHEKWISDVIGS